MDDEACGGKKEGSGAIFLVSRFGEMIAILVLMGKEISWGLREVHRVLDL